MPPDDYQPSRRGPRVKINQALVDRFIAVILQGNFRQVACKIVGVHKTTLKRWLRTGAEYPDSIYAQLRTRLMEAEAAVEANATATILAVGRNEDVKHLEWWLERKYPERWSRYRGELKELKREVAELKKLIEGLPGREAESI